MLFLLHLERESQLRDPVLAEAAWTDARHIERLYNEYISLVRVRLEREFKRPETVIDGVPYLSTVQTARALGVGEFHLANIRERGRLHGEKLGRRAIYSRTELERFITEPMGDTSPYSALAYAFLRWLEAEEPEPVIAATGS